MADDDDGGGGAGCPVSHAQLTAALKASVAATGGPSNGGFDLHMWASVVNRDGVVCAVTCSGDDGRPVARQRVISAQKANTANAFSLPGLALSTGNLREAVQPGGRLFGLQHSNPVETAAACGGHGHAGGSARRYGERNDPLVGDFIGVARGIGSGDAAAGEP